MQKLAFTPVRLSAAKRSKLSAFTLVELLVVIGIIAVLISILLPSLNKARDQAESLKCQNTLKQFGIADQMYMNNNKNWHMPAWWGLGYQYNRMWPGHIDLRKALGMPILNSMLNGTVNNQSLWCYIPPKWYCPKSLRGVGFSSETSYMVDANTLSIDKILPVLYSYAMNVDGVDDQTAGTTPAGNATVGGSASKDPTTFDSSNAPYADNIAHGDDGIPSTSPPAGAVNRAGTMACWGAVHGVKAGKIHNPAGKLFITESVNAAGVVGAGCVGYSNPINGQTVATSTAATNPNNYGNYDQVGETAGNQGTTNNQRTTAWRHRGYGNVLFFDGHVESLRKDRFYIPDPTNPSLHAVNDQLWRLFK